MSAGLEVGARRRGFRERRSSSAEDGDGDRATRYLTSHPTTPTGEYEPQIGFGWSNGVCLHLIKKYGMLATLAAADDETDEGDDQADGGDGGDGDGSGGVGGVAASASATGGGAGAGAGADDAGPELEVEALILKSPDLDK